MLKTEKVYINKQRKTKMKNIYTIILALATAINLQAQTPTWLWANRAGGVASEEGTAITVDVLGNTYITGVFSGPTCSFGTTTLTNVSFTDVFIAKYDASANLVWAKVLVVWAMTKVHP